MITPSTNDAPAMMTGVPLNIVQEFGIGLYSRWNRVANGATLIVIRRTCSTSLDMCSELTILDVSNEVATPVHPSSWIEWIKQRKITKVYKR